MSAAATSAIPDLLKQCATTVDRALDAYLAKSGRAPARLAESMRYSVEAGGKRLRPALVLLSSRACGGADAAALPAAAAIECVHTFSLIHDDLPAMDDDDLRRGRPTNHKVFGEAMAILAGDALVTLAFEILATQSAEPITIARMVAELADATGWQGMIGGQVDDIDGESNPPHRERVERIHAMKTARLIQSACRLGAIAAAAPRPAYDALSQYGHELGLAFQIVDDLLDVTATTEALGKRAGKDETSEKQTYPRVFGVETSMSLARQAVDRAKAAVAPLGPVAEPLADLADFMAQRQS